MNTNFLYLVYHLLFVMPLHVPIIICIYHSGYHPGQRGRESNHIVLAQLYFIQGRRQDFENQKIIKSQNFCPSRFSYSTTSNPFILLLKILFKKSNLQFSNVLEEDLLGKYLVITTKKNIIENSS